MLFAITVGASVVVVNAPFYIGREIYESMKEGHVECNGRVFSVRKKGRTAFGKAKGSYHVIDPDIITQIFGKPQHCNPETIAELKRRSDPLKLTKQDEKSHSPTKVD